MSDLNAFIDESGSYGFNFINHNTHFVVTVILVEKGEKTEQLTRIFTEIIQERFHGAEVKSSKINDRTRKKILDIVKDYAFTYYSLIVDKRHIYDDSGVHNWRESFYKFLYRQLYSKLYCTFSNVDIYADEIIDKKFVIGLKNYLLRETQNTLYQSITFHGSHDVPLIQLADIIGGTINRNITGKSVLDVYYILDKQNAGFVLWPPKKTKYYKEFVTDDGYAYDIRNLSLLRANNYIDKNKNNDNPEVLLRVRFIEYLKEVLLYRGDNARVYGAEIITNISYGYRDKINENYFKTRIVAPLRDEDVLITSNRKGYKLPSCKNDILEFFEMFFANIDPMIKRIKNCYDAIKLATQNKLDLLEDEKYSYLKEIFNRHP